MIPRNDCPDIIGTLPSAASLCPRFKRIPVCLSAETQPRVAIDKMANADENAGWYAWITQGSIIPPEYSYILRLVSAFFVRRCSVFVLEPIYTFR